MIRTRGIEGASAGSSATTILWCARGAVAVFAAATLAGCGSGASSKTVSEHSATASVTATTSTASSSETLPVLVARTQSAVIRVEASGCGTESIGTGFLIGPRLVATVEHVIDGATSINLKQGNKVVATGTVIGEDPARDVALVEASAPISGAVLKLAPRAPELGESVAALGFPLGLPLTVTQGSVSGLGRSVPINGISRQQMVQTDAAVNPGNSGGPLLALDTGEVVGLVDLGATQANEIAFAVSAQVAQPLLQAWQTAPQPVPASTCSSAAPPQPATTNQQPPSPVPASTSTYTGQAFSIEYPSDWQVQNAEHPESYGTDTTIVSPSEPSILLRVDVNAHGASDPQSAAAPVISSVSQEPGYHEIDDSLVTFDGYPALHWEFTVPESGVVLHKEDVFIVDTSNGENVAVLTQAPASDYNSLAAAFATLRNTLSIN